MMDRHLDDALRALPRRDGRSDWSDLQARISALKPARAPGRRLFVHRYLITGASLALVLGGIVLTWRHLAVPSEAIWRDAHRDANVSDPWGDPWLAAAVETSR